MSLTLRTFTLDDPYFFEYRQERFWTWLELQTHMSTSATQKRRLAELTTPLGKDKLLLTSFAVHEGISELFEVDVECLSPDAGIDFGAAIGKPCNIRFETVGAKTRHFSGILTEASWFGEQEMESAYRLTLRPWLWLLSQTSDCRIFQNLSVVDIIKKVFDDSGIADYKLQLRESYPPLEYCVQYRETSFNFVSRLMERFGIYYHFVHDADRHRLVLCDARSSHDLIPDLSECRFVGMGARTRDNEEYVTTWQVGRSFQPGKVTLGAFDFGAPQARMLHEQTAPGGYTHDALEVYDYPEKYKNSDRDDLGKKFAQARLFASQAQDHRRQATGNAPSLYPGGLTRIFKHPVDAENSEFLVVSARHSFTGEQFRAGGHARSSSYTGSYLLQPTTRPFKARAVTPHPVIAGPQTAMVVGPDGEEVHTDKYGRIKVKFHWDRSDTRDEKSSRWVRVAQSWSSKAWGGIIIPRIGMEVVVEFIEGDPDRPLVVGTVYNADNSVPYALPANKTQSGFKTRSSKRGTEANYNELTFEDKRGAEFIRLHAEKDFNATIEDAETRIIKGKNKRDAGETARETTIERGDDVLSVKGDHISTVNRHQELSVVENRTATVGKDEKIDIGSNQTIHVGKTIRIEAGTSITLIVGQSKITLTGTSIEIKTPTLTTKSTFTDIEATATLTEKAGIIKLN